MKINSIKIENLFGIFDYDISFKKNENVLIITGPNGFGKTMVLNIIFSLFNRKFLFFQKLVFDKITLNLNEDIKIIISKSSEEKPKISFSFYETNTKNNGKDKDKLIDTFDYSNRLDIEIERNIERYLPVHKIAEDKWVDHRTDRILSIEDLINDYADQLPDKVSKNILRIKSAQVNVILDSIQVHLIREQRLFKKAQNIERNYREEKEQTVMIDTIQTYAKELKQFILSNIQKSFNQTQALDSSYLDRLIDEKNKIS